jgi:hypothetical protein
MSNKKDIRNFFIKAPNNAARQQSATTSNISPAARLEIRRNNSDVIELDFTTAELSTKPVGRPLKLKPEQNEIQLTALLEPRSSIVIIGNDANTTATIQFEDNKSNYIWPDGLKLLLKHYCHKWDLNGNHLGWNDTNYVINKIQELVPAASNSTIRNKYTLEKQIKNDGAVQTLTKKPDLTVSIVCV